MSGLQVIGAGLGRTGTLSVKQALEDLGFNPCHHMYETFKHPERNHKHHFTSILANENVSEHLEDVFGGYKATVDYPGCMFYEDFMKMNPDAKVILTVRDSPEAWVKSVEDTLFSLHTASNWLSWKFQKIVRSVVAPAHIPVVVELMTRTHGVDPSDPKTDLAQMYTDWINRVKETVPAEKMLVFNVKQGWKPLCDFLGVPVPDTPFPRVNSSEEWKKRNWKKRYLPNFALCVVILVVGCLFYNFISVTA